VVNDSSNPSPSITQMFYIHADHLNTPRVVVNRAGAMRWSWMAEPFGSNSESNNPQGLGTFSFNLRMPGQYFDAESGLNYNYFRSYDSGVGRYTQSDPIGFGGGINTYAYVGGNPVSYADPWGLIRYNAPAPRTVPVDGETSKKLVCVETCLMGRTRNLSLDLLVTGGAEKAKHSSSSYHYKGEACDISTSNPVSQEDMNSCAASCGFGGGQLELFPKNPNRDHWHLQLTPGNGVPAIGPANGPIPIVYPKK
jgi:RHS repeat-associated protein